jgi:hypothetical protein
MEKMDEPGQVRLRQSLENEPVSRDLNSEQMNLTVDISSMPIRLLETQASS